MKMATADVYVFVGEHDPGVALVHPMTEEGARWAATVAHAYGTTTYRGNVLVEGSGVVEELAVSAQMSGLVVAW